MKPPLDPAHFVGIGGSGMAPLAEILRGLGARVTGSDRHRDQGRDLPVFGRLSAAGIPLRPQDGSGVRPGLSAVVVSSAIEPGNPDVEAARRAGIPVRHRSEALARLARGKRSLAVTGTAGKTTVAGMLGWVFESAGRDPTVIVGGPLPPWTSGSRTGSARLGASDWWIFEADESDRSCLRYSPDWAVLTNVSKDHFEWAETVALFREFAGRARNGTLAGAAAAAAVGRDGCRPVRFEPGDPRPVPGGWRFELEGAGFVLPLPGRHNAENALLAAAAAVAAGIDPGEAARALARFPGVGRRLERVSAPDSPVEVFDDMAHDPAKIRAAWSAVAASGRPVAGVWRPHGFAPLAMMFDELAEVFDGLLAAGGRLFLLPVYYAGGTARGGRSSEDLAAALRARGRDAEAVADEAALVGRVAGSVPPGASLLIMGARDPGLPGLARRCARRLRERSG